MRNEWRDMVAGLLIFLALFALVNGFEFPPPTEWSVFFWLK